MEMMVNGYAILQYLPHRQILNTLYPSPFYLHYIIKIIIEQEIKETDSNYIKAMLPVVIFCTGIFFPITKTYARKKCLCREDHEWKHGLSDCNDVGIDPWFHFLYNAVNLSYHSNDGYNLLGWCYMCPIV